MTGDGATLTIEEAGAFPFVPQGGAGDVATVSDILRGDPLKFIKSHPCKTPPGAGRGNNRLWVFGGANAMFSAQQAEVQTMLSDTREQFLRGEGIGIGKEALRRMKGDEALMDFALMAALDARPYRTFQNGAARNVYYTDAGAYRVRRIAKNRDCWIDFKAKGARDWAFNHFRRNAFEVIAYLNPMLRGMNLKRPADFKRVVLWYSLLAGAAGRKPEQLGTGGRRLFTRRAFLAAAAKHPGLRAQTRIALAAMSLAAKGEAPRDFNHAVQKTLGAAGLGTDAQRIAKRTLGAFRGEVWDWINGGGFRWRGFLSWKEQVLTRLAADGRLAEFRGVWRAWEFCLTREGGGWRWRGWHLMPGRGLRKDAGAARRLASAARTTKQTAQRLLRVGELIGFFERKGISLSISLGLRGSALRNKITAVKERASGWLLPVIRRCLSPPPQAP